MPDDSRRLITIVTESILEGELCEVEIPIDEARQPLHLRAMIGEGAADGKPVVLCLRPEDLELHVERPSGSSGANIIDVEVIDTVYLGTYLECRVRVGRYEVCVQTDHYKPLAPRQKVFLAFQPDHALCLAA